MTKLLTVAAAICLTVSAASAQSSGSQGYRNQGPPPTADNGFSFQGDQIQPMPDTRDRTTSDSRYSQTQQLQNNGEIPKPGGGCLRYGAVGAAGGHLAGHGVLGAVAGCITGHIVRKREQAAINQQYGR